jgi:hypothetical protein
MVIGNVERGAPDFFLKVLQTRRGFGSMMNYLKKMKGVR